MEYMNVVRNFAERTIHNLGVIQKMAKEDANSVFEVTQLMNSLLGLLVFPQQEYVTSIPRTSLQDLESNGWPIPRVVGEYPQARDLRHLIRLLRNSIAHFNVRFKSDERKSLHGIKLWNIDPRTDKITWKAELTVEETETLVRKFVDLLLDDGGFAAA